ncbi:MAG TPA: hypothetical protein VFK44_01795 [Bacillales bacterium]|nr:hypothetical protein [Bacillales bacterium]
MFWDIAGPVALILFAANLIWSIVLFKKGAPLTLIVCAFISIGLCQVFWWSIGKGLAVVPALQVFGALFLWLRQKNHPA